MLLSTPCFQVSSQSLKELNAKSRKAIKGEHFAEAIPFLMKLVANDSSNSETLFNLALAKYNTGDYKGCVKYSTRGIAVDSAYAAHHFRRGVCHAELEDFQSAIRDYNKAIELDKKSFSYFNRAIARWKSGDPNGGITDFTQALALEPKDETAFYYRALIYEEIGDTTAALTDLKKSISLKPNDPDIYYERAHLNFIHRNYAFSKADCAKCIELDPAYILAYLSLSEISLITGDWLVAYQHASSAVSKSNNVDEQAIGLLFKCAANKLMDRSPSSDEAQLNKALKELKETIWKFDHLQQALKQQNISEEKRTYISTLIGRYKSDKNSN
jgi:tetratricopeptide (TPR) repeat protein